jgi:Tol biopolymer transport system component
MALGRGTRLGPYEVLAPLGAGGMGEVYRARDTRLGRDVAVKVLPSELTHDADRRRRFEQEARIVASLSHPGILALHDFGEHDGVAYAVTELLEGETLRARLDRGPLPQAVAVSWGVSLAEALAAAHVRGVVHRDLKPENVFVTREERIKVLDFGLARPGSSSEPDPQSHETYSALTQPGAVVGTVGYMSPEQLRGEPVDARSDLFALGCVLFEMLAGTRAFARATSAETLAAILKEEPAPPAHQVAPPLHEVVGRCLVKDRERRFQSAQDVAFALGLAAGSGRAPASGPAPSRRGRVAVGGAGLAAAAVLVVVGAVLWRARGVAPPVPTVVALTTGALREVSPVISPDGKFVAYMSSAEGRSDLWVQFVGGGTAVNLTEKSGLEFQSNTGIGGMDISPDGTSIALHAGPHDVPDWLRGVYLIPAPLGGAAQKLVERAAAPRFSPDGTRVVFVRPAPVAGDSIVVIGTDGQGERVLVPPLGGAHLHQPAWASDGAAVYFIRSLTTQNRAPTGIWRVPASGGTPTPFIETLGVAKDPLATPDGVALIYSGDRGGAKLDLWWRPLRGGGERRLTTGAGDYAAPRVSRDGRRLVCEARTPLRSLRVLDPRAPGTPWLALTGARTGDSEPSLAAGRVAFTATRNGNRDIWIGSANGGNLRPLTSGAEGDWSPSLSPDGRQVAFLSDRSGRIGLWIVPSDGGVARHVVDADILDRASWSPDAQRLVYAAPTETDQTALWIVPVSGGTPWRIPNVQGRAPEWSTREDLIAYMGIERPDKSLRLVTSAGEPRHPELAPTVKLVSAASWSPDGRRLALAVSPGTGEASVSMLDLDTGRLETVAQAAPLSQMLGIGWLPDGRLVFGLAEWESQVLLFDGLR